MKKRDLTSLRLNKKSISTFKNSLHGGIDPRNLVTFEYICELLSWGPAACKQH